MISKANWSKWYFILIKSQIDALIKKGDYAQAYDLSKEAITASCDDEGLKYFLQHRAVLCLIRSGALEQAQAEYFKYNLNLVTENEDILALGGKLFKDFSEYSNGQKRLRYRRSALKKYAEAFEQSGGYFSGINAATLSMLLKDTVTAHTIARHILASLKIMLKPMICRRKRSPLPSMMRGLNISYSTVPYYV